MDDMASTVSPYADSGRSPPAFRRCVIETCAALGVLAAMDRFAFHGAFATFNPHPFWIVVLLAAFQYGARGGAFGAAAASLALYAGGLPPQGGAEFFQYAATITMLPALWFLAGAAFGGLRTLHIQQTCDLETRLAQALGHAETIATGFKRASDEIQRLEARLASDAATVDTLMQDLAAFGAAPIETEEERLSRFAQHCLGAPSVTIWIFSPIGSGDDALSGVQLSPDAISALFVQKQPAEFVDLPEDIAVAAPIVSGADVRGLLIVWRDDEPRAATAARLGRRAALVGQALGTLIDVKSRSSPVVPLEAGLKQMASAS